MEWRYTRFTLTMLTYFHPSVHPPARPSVRMFVDDISGTFWKKKTTIGSVHFRLGIWPYGWVSRPLFIFVFLASISTIWWRNIWAKMGFPDLKNKTKLSSQFISYLAFNLLGCVSWPPFIVVFPLSIIALRCLIFARKVVSIISFTPRPGIGL